MKKEERVKDREKRREREEREGGEREEEKERRGGRERKNVKGISNDTLLVDGHKSRAWTTISPHLGSHIGDMTH